MIENIISIRSDYKMTETKYYFVKYRQRENSEDAWDELNGVSQGIPFLNANFRNDWYYIRIIDFYMEITEAEFHNY